ncbi:Glutathione peroxidase [Paramicrosporidium saccamoebae]|uniref:Glutathione peroxidase n=1 Tax=Paramicrosporidium saccamoebae TaxID=1246581 RepID=A0A2H9TQT8_9FUNG|nr:Glutathione peroxidase [Paramicrosporidium saccamoebae]
MSPGQSEFTPYKMLRTAARRFMSSPPKTFYDFSARDILGSQQLDFSQFRGQVVIVVNAATYCGYTKSNYSGLSELLDKYYDKGLRVMMFPCNQFMNQEKDEAEKIKAFAEQYDKRFILAEKVDVNGSDAHPLWKFLKDKCPGFLVDAIKWNFTKFIIDKSGNPVARFAPNDEPKAMTSKIEELL